jgi:uncharacterized protein YcbK (DUF882 family)
MFKYFNIDEFSCQETGENEMSEEFIHKLDELREACSFPFQITSGFRSKEHSIEKRKQKPGQHALGIACDIAVSGGAQRMKIVQQALSLGFTGIGVAKTFIHVDIRETAPVLWCY